MERFETFTVLITNLNRCIKKIKTEEMSEYGFKSTHVSCLYYIFREGGLTAKELCDCCDEDKANISRSTEYLEKSGYIICNDNMQKRYRSRFELTEKGISVAKQIAEKIDNVLSSVSEGVSSENRDIMYKSLFQINDNLQKIINGYSYK